MKDKLEQMRRIERQQRRLKEMSAWRLARQQWENRKLADDHAGMIEALGEGLMAFGPLSEAGTRRLRKIEREMAQAQAIEKQMEARALNDGRRAKLADRRLTALREAARDGEERKSLEELIEATLAAASASRKP